MSDGISLADIQGMVRRRWWMPALTLVLGAPVAVAIATALPPVFASTAQILVESQVIPEELARSTVAQSVDERIQFLQQSLLTRANLLDIAEANNVFAARRGLSSSQIVEQMRKSTSIRGSQSGQRRNRSVTGVTITFRAADPNVAARVANDFVTRLLSQNAEQRTNSATRTLAFFDQQVARLEAAIESASAEIERFKSENQASLPQNLSLLQSELTSLRDRAFSLSAQRAALLEQRRLTEQTLSFGGSAAGAPRSAEAAELERLRNALVTQSATLAPTHPTIRLLRARIEALEVSTERPANADEPGSASLREAQLQVQKETIERQLEMIDQQILADAERMVELERSIATTPGVQIRLEGLERNYEALQSQLREALQKQAQAVLGERLEASQQAERLQVVEQAVASDRPISPNRPAIMAVGVVGSAGIGLLLAALAELLNRSLRSARDVERLCELAPLGVIPYVRTTAEETRRRWFRRSIAAGAVIAPMLGLFMLDRFIMPLPVAAERIVEISGLNAMIETLTIRFGR